MEVAWEDVGETAIKWAAELGDVPRRLQSALDTCAPSLSVVSVDLASKRAYLETDLEDRRDVVSKLATICPVASPDERPALGVKVAYSPTLKAISTALNFQHGNTFGIPSVPTPLTAALTTGLVGAGLGYGAGTLAENLLPDTWERGRLRRTLALAGGLGGALTAAPWAYASMATGHAPWSSWPLNVQSPQTNKVERTPEPYELERIKDVGSLAQAPSGGLTEHNIRAAAWGNSSAGASGLSPIPVDSFNRVIWGDPRVANELTSQTKALASGVVTAASALGGRRSSIVTPADVAHIAVGMGSGWLSGSLLGHGLGTLMGMPKTTQETLKNTGMWAGAVHAFVNNAFGSLPD